MPYTLSQSSLSLMKECPRCFWLEQNRIWKRPIGIFPSLPSGMDRILKKHFDIFRDKGELPPELKENEECKGMSLFSDKGLLDSWRDRKIGLKFADNEGNILIGMIDNVLVKDSKLVVLDYKTRGYELKDNSHEYYQDQLDIYTLLLKKNNHETEDFGFLLFYIPNKVLETGEVLFDTKLVKMKVYPFNAQKLFDIAIKLLKGKCPEDRCEWCRGIDI